MYVGKRVTLCINNLRVENYHLPPLVCTTSGVEEQAQVGVPAAVNTTATHLGRLFLPYVLKRQYNSL